MYTAFYYIYINTCISVRNYIAFHPETIFIFTFLNARISFVVSIACNYEYIFFMNCYKIVTRRNLCESEVLYKGVIIVEFLIVVKRRAEIRSLSVKRLTSLPILNPFIRIVIFTIHRCLKLNLSKSKHNFLRVYRCIDQNDNIFFKSLIDVTDDQTKYYV